MKKITKTQFVSLSALLAGSLGAYAGNGIRIVGANEVVCGWEAQKYEIIVDNDAQLTSFQLRMRIPAGFEVTQMPVATQRIPTTGKLQAEWKGGDEATANGEMYVGFTKTDLETFIQGQSGTAVAEFWMRPKPGYQLDEQEDGTWSKTVDLEIWDEQLTAVDGDEDVEVAVDNADDNNLTIKVVADRIAMYVEPTTQAAYPVYYPVEEVEAEKIPFRLCLDNTIGCSSLSFEIHTDGLDILKEYEAANRLQGGFAIQDQGIKDGKHVYKVVCADLTNNNAITGNFGRFVKIFAQVSKGFKKPTATLEVTNIELSPIEGNKVYDGKGFSYEIENLAYTIIGQIWPEFDRALEQLKKEIDENWTPAINELKYAGGVYYDDLMDIKGRVEALRLEILQKRDDVELTVNDSPNGFIATTKIELLDLLNEACKFDLEKYYNGVNNYWYGDEANDIPQTRLAVYTHENADAKAKVEVIENALDALKAKIDEVSLHNPESHAALVAEAEAIETEITNVAAYVAILNQIANVQAAIDYFETEVALMKYASRYEGEELTAAVDAAKEWVAEVTANAAGKFAALELTSEDYVMGAMMQHVQAVNEALNNAAKYDASCHAQAATNAWMGNEEDGIVGAQDNILVKMATVAEPGQSALQEDIDAIGLLIQEMWDKIDQFAAYTDANDQAWYAERYELIIATIKDLQVKAAMAANDAALDRVTLALTEVKEYAEAVNNIIASFQHAKGLEAEIAGVPNDALAWVEETLAAFKAKHDVEIDLNAEEVVIPEEWLDETTNVSLGERSEWLMAVEEALNAAAKYDAHCYTQAAAYAWAGDEEDIVGAMENILAKKATLPTAGQYVVDEKIADIEALIKDMIDHYNDYVQHSEEAHAYFPEQYQKIIDAIENLKAYAAEAANEAALARVSADIDLVKEAIAIYEAEIQNLMYARRNEQFDIQDAKDWVAETSKEYSDKALAGELDENTNIHQQALGVMNGVYNTLFEAAKWDANWYYNAANNAYNGNEEDGIEGAKKDIDEKKETLTGDALQTVVDAEAEIEAALAKMAEDLAAYKAYNYKELHADIVKQYEKITELINALQGTAAELANAAAWVRIQTQIDQVQQAVDAYKEAIKDLMYAGQVLGGEEAAEVIDEVEKWISDTTAEYEAKFAAGELDEDSGVMGAMKEQLDNVAKALWLAGLYDAGRYYQGALNYLNGDEEEGIEGKIDNVLEKKATVAEPGQAALQEAIDQIGTLLQEMADALENYTTYTGDGNEWFAERYETIINAINDLVAQAAEAANDAALDRVKEQLEVVTKAANEALETIAGLNNVARQEQYSEVANDALAWVEEQLAAYTEAHDSENAEDWLDETTNVPAGDINAKLQDIYESINAAAKADVEAYYNIIYGRLYGIEDGLDTPVYDEVLAKLEHCYLKDVRIIRDQLLAEILNNVSDLEEAVENYASYAEEDHAMIIDLYNLIQEKIDNLCQQTAQAEANRIADAENELKDLKDYWAQVLAVLEGYETFYGEEGYNVRKNAIEDQLKVAEKAIADLELYDDEDVEPVLPYGPNIKQDIDILAANASLEESLHQIEVANGIIAEAQAALEGPHADKAGLQEEIDALQAQVAESIVESEDIEVVPSYAEMVENLKELVDELIAKIDDATVILGDLNHDGKVSVADYNKLVRMIVTADDEYDQADAADVAADITEDELINVADVSAIINILRGVVNDGPAKAPVMEGNNGLSMEVVANNHGVRRIAIKLANQNVISNAQFDIVLPEGVSVVGSSIAERAGALNLHTNDLGNGTYRVVLSSFEQNTIAIGEGAIVYLDLTGSSSADITMVNALAADVMANTYALNLDNAVATGIDSLADAIIDGAKKVYNVGGQMINNLKKGVNIIVGNDGKATKVYKK